jgi:hypothetical protein
MVFRMTSRIIIAKKNGSLNTVSEYLVKIFSVEVIMMTKLESKDYISLEASIVFFQENKDRTIA